LLTFSLAWIPPVFAAAACGLQLTFWEHGTNATVEMFDLLLFSYVVRTLIEYRIDQVETRLYRAAFVFGVGMTGNPAMIGFFPFFIMALVWTRKLNFFNLRFLGRMGLWGLVGLSLYLLLPTVNLFAKDVSVSFWETLRSNLLSEKLLLTSFPKKTLLLLSLYSVLPVFLLSIRWASQFGDPSRIGVVMTTVMFHLSHVVVLLACLWVTLDPAFSPRARDVGYGLAFLPFYFLGALSVGYYSGYLLLVSRAIRTRLRTAPPLARFFQHATTAFILGLLIAIPAALIYRNVPQIRLTNGPLQNQLAADLASGLPKSGVILSDDPRRLWIVQDWLARHGKTHDYIPLCTQWLPQPAYQAYLQRHYPGWTPPFRDAGEPVASDVALVAMLQKLAQDKELCYLHPSFGYYFEYFNGEPNGLTERLTPYSGSYLIPPPLSTEVIARNEKFWADAQDGILATIRRVTKPRDPTWRPSGVEKIFHAIRLKPKQNQQAAGIGALYSRNLVNWAVELQRAGDFDQAAKHFALAHDLNPDNVVAEINLEFNEKFRAGQPIAVEIDKSLEEQFGKYRSWAEVLTQNGPYDEPSLTYAQGYVFARGNLLRQSAAAFDRVRAFSTNDLASRLWLAQVHLMRGFPDQALALAREVRDCAGRTPGASTNLTDLFTLEASAYFIKKEPEIAAKVIETNLAAHPGNVQLMAAACKTFADYGQFTNALVLTKGMLQIEPTNAATWLNQGCFLVEVSEFDQAVRAFDHVLTLETNNATALLYRAIANLRADNLDASLKDYEIIQQQYPKLHQAYFGLGEIAYRRNDTNTAIRQYEAYLSNAPPNQAESKLVANRLKDLRGAPPDPPR
jgi:tetratricopeptide (TPR) repeat protein